MRVCDICPGGAACAGINLAPVLVRVFDLYAGGETDKFEILFAPDEDEEELLEIHTTNVSRACWTRATLSAIAVKYWPGAKARLPASSARVLYAQLMPGVLLNKIPLAGIGSACVHYMLKTPGARPDLA